MLYSGVVSSRMFYLFGHLSAVELTHSPAVVPGHAHACMGVGAVTFPYVQQEGRSCSFVPVALLQPSAVELCVGSTSIALLPPEAGLMLFDPRQYSG